MKQESPNKEQISFLYPNMMDQLNRNNPLLVLSDRFDWKELEQEFSSLYSNKGRPAKPIRLMAGLLLLKQVQDLSDEKVVEQWVENPYYQSFCGEVEFQQKIPAVPEDLVYFRKRIGIKGVEKIFKMSIGLLGKKAEEEKLNLDTTVQEKNITYPTDAKQAIKVICHCNKIAKKHGIQQRRTYAKEAKNLRLQVRFFRHPRKRKNAVKATSRLRVIARKLIRELERKLPEKALYFYQERFEICMKVLNQEKTDKNKIYSLHEPQVYCIAKGKDHKPYEYGSKASIASCAKSRVIVSAVSLEKNVHDSKTIEEVVSQIKRVRQTPAKLLICDRGYRGSKKVDETEIMLPSKSLKTDSKYQKEKKRKLCRGRAGIEPIIGHLKSDFRLRRNFLKGIVGDSINLLLACTAWNLKLFIRELFLPFFYPTFLFLFSKNRQKQNREVSFSRNLSICIGQTFYAYKI